MIVFRIITNERILMKQNSDFEINLWIRISIISKRFMKIIKINYCHYHNINIFIILDGRFQILNFRELQLSNHDNYKLQKKKKKVFEYQCMESCFSLLFLKVKFPN